MFPQKLPDVETMKQIVIWVAGLSFVSSSVAVVSRHATEKVLKVVSKQFKKGVGSNG